MAIKAGLVGVNPKGVDKNGMPIASGGGSVDAYTKTETDALLNGKVSNSQLTANNKTFNFAYDATNEKYGYKLDGTGDFIPFESAGGGPGWVKPAELTQEGLVVSQYCPIISGGYMIGNDLCYVDIVVQKVGSSTSLGGFPKGESAVRLIGAQGDSAEAVENLYYGDAYPQMGVGSDASAIGLGTGSGTTQSKYIHIFGCYPLATNS